MTHHRAVNREVLWTLAFALATSLLGCGSTEQSSPGNAISTSTGTGGAPGGATGGSATGSTANAGSSSGGIAATSVGGASSPIGGTSASESGGVSSTLGGTSPSSTGGSSSTLGGTSAGNTGGTSSAGGAMTGGASSSGTSTTGGANTGGSATGIGGATNATGGTKASSGGTSNGGVDGSGGNTVSGGANGTTGGNATTYPDKGDGLAMTPPMGWNSWNYFESKISDSMIRAIADAMVSSGMKDAGYIYVNIDDTWMKAGRQNGKLVPDPNKFPNGISPLADYVHSKGLKLGIYGDRGTTTCAEIAESGSYGHETEDAQTWASWGVDYVKYDNCAVGDRTDAASIQADYEKMGAALKATGRPIVYSLCAWGWKGEWMIATGHLWRATGDIADCWDNSCTLRQDWQNGFTDIVDQVETASIANFAGPGHWNDADMLEVGNGHMSNTEYISHFSLWAIMASPLIAGNDLRSMSTATKNILLNQEVIAIDQDPAGIQGTRVVDNGDLEVWMKPLGSHDGTEKAVVLFNRGAGTVNISVNYSDIGLSGAATVRDLWAKKDLGTFTDSFSADVESHGVVMVKIVKPSP